VTNIHVDDSPQSFSAVLQAVALETDSGPITVSAQVSVVYNVTGT